MNQALKPRPRFQANGLPSTWHEVKSNQGEVLYWRREHTGYEVWPVYGRFQVVLEAQGIGDPHDTLTHAIAAARDHMHASAHAKGAA